MKKRVLFGEHAKSFWVVAIIGSLLGSLLIGYGLHDMVFAESTNQSPVSVEMEHIILTPTGADINVVHIVNAKNNQDKEYTDPLQITLPSGFSNLKVMMDEKLVVKTETGFTVKEPIPAKQTATITYSYNLPQQGGHYIVSLTPSYFTENLNILLAQETATLVVQERDMQDQGVIDLDGKKFHVYSTSTVEAGKALNMVMLEGSATSSGNNQASTVTKQSTEFHNPGHIRMWNESQFRTFNPHVLLGVFASILIFGVGYFGYRRWKDQSTDEAGVIANDQAALIQQLELKQQVIFQRLVELEESFEQNEIDSEEYEERKQVYKARLMEVKMKLRDLE